MDILGLILARGGSKSIPHKNTISVGGKPLIAWSILAAKQSKPPLRVIVSTDDEEIASISRQWGAETPFLRPPELSRDETPSIDAVLHALDWVEENEHHLPDFLVLLQATSPLRSGDDVSNVISMAYEKNADAVVSIAPCQEHPYIMMSLDTEGHLSPFIKLDEPIKRRQDLPAVYGLNGAIYLSKPEVLRKRKTWYTPDTYGYVMPEERSLDIDSPWQLYLANLVLNDRTRK
jgi:CMP-N,N'-diacetyllegionaminic acid synthase